VLVSLVVQLRPHRAGTLPLTTGPAMHAIFLKCLARSNPALAQELHDQQSVKPYTVSGLQQYSPHLELLRRPKDLELSLQQLYWFRVTSLEPGLSKFLLTDFIQNLPTELDILERPFELVKVISSQEQHAGAGISSYEELLSLSLSPKTQRINNKISLYFHALTTFKSAGRSLPLPLPVQTFSSLATRWNTYSPIPLDPALFNFVEDDVSISGYDIQSELAMMEGSNKGPKLVCFRGWCEYTSFAKDSEWTQSLHLLSHFAFFSGVGYKTTQGFGQVVALDRKP